MVEAHRPHSQKWTVSRCGFSSKGAEPSSLAASEIETTSNWKSLPSEKEYNGRLQPSLTQRASIQEPTEATLQGKSYLSNTVRTVFPETFFPDLF
jgi:L,D-peptidoglycan transpeptidase YkuD (ErfK/YbiS/YcfS/YnhG family)